MYFQVETHVWMELTEQLQQFFGTVYIVVESTVEYPHILDAMRMDGLQPLSDNVNG